MEESEAASHRQNPAVSQQYDAWAQVYDQLWSRYVNQTLPVLQRAAAVGAGERVLDLACGTGELGWRILEEEPKAHLVGVDIAPAMVERARTKLDGHPGARVEQADAHDLPFEDEAFDAVVCANTFHYFSHPTQALAEVSRVLRSAGRFVLLDWCRDFWTCRGMDAVLRWVDPAHQACYTLSEMRALLETMSFRLRYDFRYRFDGIWGMMVVEAVRP